MSRFIGILIAGITLSIGQAWSCSTTELRQKQRAYGDATTAAFQRDPGGDAARRAKVEDVTRRYYSDLKNATNGSYIIDMLCKENDELLAIYK
jgi:hypothetical protein